MNHDLRHPEVKTNIFVATENRLVRESLARMLQKRTDFVVEAANHLSEFKSVGSGHQCDLVLTDSFCEPGDKEALRNFSQREGQTKLVLFGMAADESLFLEAVRAGVSGYLLHDASATDIVAAVRMVSQGAAVCPPRLCVVLMRCVAGQRRDRGKLMPNEAPVRPFLTSRQLELVELVAKGMTNKEIAAKLNLSEFAVKSHMRRIMKQTQAEDRHEAVKMIYGEIAAAAS